MKENEMDRKLIFPAVVLVLAMLACSVQINPTNPPPILPTDTLVPPTLATDTPIPPTSVTDTSIPTFTETILPTITDTPAPTITSSETPQLPTPSPSSVPSSVPEFSVDNLRNTIYYAPYYGKTIKLDNGFYSEGSGATYYSVQMLDIYAYGDLDGDKKVDAAVILAENGGGTGVFESVVAVLNRSGIPHQISQVKLGDRVMINSADIARGVIHLNMTVHGPSDPACCPTQTQAHSFWLLGNKLWLMRVTSGPTGVERYINITYPGNWLGVTNPFTINGSVSISPFENNLGYGIYLLDGTKINESSLLVTSSGMGTPGTFTRNFNLSSAGVTGFVIFQFKDLSAADGSILALGSVVLTVH
jgi:hypothetical protein